MSTLPVGSSRCAVPARSLSARILLSLVIVVATSLALTVHLQSLLSEPYLGAALFSEGLLRQLAGSVPSGLPFGQVFLVVTAVAALLWMLGAVFLAAGSGSSWRTMLCRWGVRFLWLDLLFAFEVLWSLGGLFGPPTSAHWLEMAAGLLPFFHIIAWGGWIASAAALLAPPEGAGSIRRALSHPAVVWLAAVLYAATFSTLAILQYRALMVPHGDTAMYEEHLWNVLHGKGFRSQLDGGRLFLGEHLEVFHLLLIPVYVLWPCLPTLNICLSVGLAAGAIAVHGITRRITGSPAAANWLGLAYLLYFPLQYLNLEASLKTFRPENFGVPLLLFALWCLELRRLRTMLLLLGLAVLAKEDYALPAGTLGLYLALWPSTGSDVGFSRRRVRWLGITLALFAAAYLWFVLALFIPFFRGGSPHYTVYFSDLGRTPAEVLSSVVSDPGATLKRVATFENLTFGLAMLVPLAGLPLAGLRRLWVLLPSLLPLLLSGLPGTHTPRFHFHAALVPVIFWAAAEGLARLARWREVIRGLGTALWGGRDSSYSVEVVAPLSSGSVAARAAQFAAACALVSGFWLGRSPLALAFYDPHAGLGGYWRVMYVPTERVGRFGQLFRLIPRAASVAATDHVRPRFTHHRECHQYGEGGLKPHVPLQAVDYIVIDLTGPYSNTEEGRRIREVDANPEGWETVWDDDLFLVVKARRVEMDGEKDTHP